jgi:hypothetical protein
MLMDTLFILHNFITAPVFSKIFKKNQVYAYDYEIQTVTSKLQAQ